MSEKWKLTQSRDGWKEKAIVRGKSERALRKEIRRIKADRDRFKKAAKKANAKLKAIGHIEKIQNNNGKLSCKFKKIELIFISLLLFLRARIGFRATSRVLKVLSPYLGIEKSPCPQTISNWVNRLSIVKTQSNFNIIGNHIVTNFSKGFAWLIDLSIGLGSGKILSVLALDLKHYQEHNHAPKLQNVICIATSVAATWTGETIMEFLNKVVASVGGAPCAFIKDGGTDLGKSVRLLNEHGNSCLNIADISHVIANLFKHEYGEHPLFEIFTSACGKISKNLKQTLLASLAPPKISSAARFMNIHRLVTWADQLLKHSPRGPAAEGSMLAKLRNSLEELPSCKAFIKQFLRDALPLLECQKILKCKGLNLETYKMSEELISTLPLSSPIRIGFSDWAKQHLAIAIALKVDSIGLPISSDSLESLFGVGKRLGTGPVKDADRIAARLPVFCGTFTEEDAKKVLTISVAQQKEIFKNQPSLVKQRRDVLPHPGTIETLAQSQERQNMQIIMNFPKIRPSIQPCLHAP